MQIVRLAREALPEARDLLASALSFDHVSTVAEEKLFGDDGARRGVALAAIEGDALAGVIAMAGRWIKLLAVAPPHRRRGIATRLLEAGRAESGGGKLRVFDHPGNYLSPGLDLRYVEGDAFLRARGFRAVGEVENIRTAVEGNPLVTESRVVERVVRATQAGYAVRRGVPGDAALLDFVAGAFAPVWAHEVRRALEGPRRAVHVAEHEGKPVAFAAADGNNQGLGWFGPAGTLPEHRGRGLGETLLIPTLIDVRGLPEAGVIAWVGPKPFYARACGAADDRRFRQYEEA